MAHHSTADIAPITTRDEQPSQPRKSYLTVDTSETVDSCLPMLDEEAYRKCGDATASEGLRSSAGISRQHSDYTLNNPVFPSSALKPLYSRLQVERKLDNLTLPSKPSPKQMQDHLRQFNTLYAEAIDLGRPVDDLVRAEWFLDSLPLDFEYLRFHYDTLPKSAQGWPVLRGLYQREVVARQRRVERDARRAKDEVDEGSFTALAVEGGESGDRVNGKEEQV